MLVAPAIYSDNEQHLGEGCAIGLSINSRGCRPCAVANEPRGTVFQFILRSRARGLTNKASLKILVVHRLVQHTWISADSSLLRAASL